MAGVNAQEYPLEPASQSTPEWERLDAVHNAFTKYCGDNLSFAPLNPSEIHSVLEVGCGSGAWAIDAATIFPHADVVAVDISPLPVREIPSNIHFFRLNIQDEVPFKAETFDVVHARLLLIHIPNAEAVINRLITLLKPGGYILLEDCDDEVLDEQGIPRGLVGRTTFMPLFHDVFRARGADPCFGREYSRVLRSLDAFSTVEIHKASVPMCGPIEDPALNALGEVWKASHIRNAENLPLRYADQGITEQVARAFVALLNDTTQDIRGDIYFVWAQKK